MRRSGSEWTLVLRGPKQALRGSTLITGFRGFGLVGYMASKYLALALGAQRIGFFYSDHMEPVILVEEDTVGFPHDVYYSEEGHALIVVNRAVPEPGRQGSLARAIAAFASDVKVERAILLGGLSREYMPENDEYGYRWLKNSHYAGKELPAPQMEAGLGVIGPLAMLHIALDMEGVPSIMVLPYSFVEGVDYEAIKTAVNIVADLLELEVDLTKLEELAESQRLIIKKIEEELASQGKKEEGGKGIYM